VVDEPSSQKGHEADRPSDDKIVPAAAALSDAVDAAVNYLDNPHSLPDDLSDTARSLIEAIAAARADQDEFDTFRATQTPFVAPPLAEDPLAVALGLVPSTDRNLSGSLLRAARQKAGLKPSSLARLLTERGYVVRAGEIIRWESSEAVPLAESEIQAIASVLGASPSDLVDEASPVVTPGLAMSKQFRDLVRRWATHKNQTLAAAQAALMRVAVAPARRGTSRDDAAVIASLQAFVEARIGEES
jgi:transcriptional regulator with XRE-family HTH domain